MFSHAFLSALFSLLFVTCVISDVTSQSSSAYKNFLYSMKKQTIDDLSSVLRRRLDYFKKSDNKQVELVFLIDGSSSVGETNFESELRFVRKLVADLIIGPKNVRIAVVVFDTGVNSYVNHLDDTKNHEKCSLLHHELRKVRYVGGNTFTLGAIQEAAFLLKNARPDAKKVVFLITDGFSNNGDPVPVADDLKKTGTKIFAFGITSGNIEELYRMSSPPSEEHAFFLESFSEFEALARRALHEDLAVGIYSSVAEDSLCSELCSVNSTSCCNANSTCSCGSLSGLFSCLCPPGYFGTGLIHDTCLPCPTGTYHDGKVPGDITICRSCPDRNQKTKKFPATSISDCVCEDGFVPSGNSCTVITCMNLAPPRNGYFVKENCSNVLNAACGVRCDIGYELYGSSVRICQRNGTWTGDQPICQPKNCPQLNPFDFGEVICTHEDEGFEVLVEYGVGSVRKREIVKRKPGVNNDGDGPDVQNMQFAVDTECRFGCPIGFNLIGSKMRTCLPITRWNGLQATCKPITCPMLPRIANGEINPSNCTQRGLRHGYGSACSVTCKAGFILKGNSTRHCTGKHGTWTGKGQIYKCVDIEPPKFACPGNMSTSTMPGSYVASINITLPSATDNSGVTPILWAHPNNTVLPVGLHEIKVHGVDASGNAESCSFRMQVMDSEKPSMENCLSPPAMLLRELLQLDWDEPSFSDNSGNVTVLKSHSENVRNGTLTFNYTAVDPSGNAATCLINATLLDFVCTELPLQNHTEGSCPHSTNFCIINCKAGFASSLPNITITCSNGHWVTHDNATDIPMLNCSEIVSPEENLITGTMVVEAANLCDGPSSSGDLQELTNEIINGIGDENLSFALHCWAKDDYGFESVPRMKRSNSGLNKVNFTVSGSWQKFYYQTSESRTEALKRKISKNSSLRVGGNPVLIERLESLAEFISCHDGSIPVRNLCVKCSIGHFFDVRKKLCLPCPVATYQNEQNEQLECLNCPPNTSTLRQGSTSSLQCKRVCQQGTYGSRVNAAGLLLAPCWPCPRGQHQPLAGQSSCLSCWKSPLLTESCQKAGLTCGPKTCRNNGTCAVAAVACSCQQGYFGDFCEKHFGPCDSSPCLNGGSCQAESARSFSCSCPYGYQGNACQYEVDHCLSNPCENGGTCTSHHTGYHCDCPDYFQGESCADAINECLLLQPCQNNGSCIGLDGGKFRCECSGDYSGQYCDKFLGCLPSEESLCQRHKIINTFCGNSSKGTCDPEKTSSLDSESVWNFPKRSTFNYLIAELHRSPFEELTACIWVQTADNFNYGTLFSLASDKSDNEFTLTDYNGLVLYVRGQRVVTDVAVNDGFWHFICVTWQAKYGTWKIYQDGNLSANGTNLATGESVPGMGSLVVGQEQDFPGGGFNPVESFIGKLTRFQIWDSALGDSRIAELADSCDRPSMNSGLKILHSVKGGFKAENTTFCKGCGEPPEIFRADAVLDGKVGRYRCHDGFLIKFPDELSPLASPHWTRQCQISGDWQPNPPICIRVSCGFPGILPHGSTIGRSYLFEDTVRFQCRDGYQLIGPRRRTCLSNGTWSEFKPYCREPSARTKCRSLTAPRRGALFLISRRPGLDEVSLPGDQAEFTCDDGFRLIGIRVLTCLPAGLWSSPAPQCTECEDPGSC